MWIVNSNRVGGALLSVAMMVLTLAAWSVAAIGVLSPARAATAERLCRLLLAPVTRAAEARDPT